MSSLVNLVRQPNRPLVPGVLPATDKAISPFFNGQMNGRVMVGRKLKSSVLARIVLHVRALYLPYRKLSCSTVFKE